MTSSQKNRNTSAIVELSKAIGKPKVFNCPSCGGAITVKSVGNSITVVCNNCSSVIGIDNENYKIISAAKENLVPTLIEIGTRGIIDGVGWEVIGYMERFVIGGDSNEYSWEEYLLYNPYYGFRFLLQSDGNWNFVKTINKNIKSDRVIGIDYNGEIFEKFTRKTTAFVRYVKGEFYWRVKVGDAVEVIDYVAPPYSLSVEYGDGETNVSLGKYISPEEVAKAFSISEMPKKLHFAFNQPNAVSKCRIKDALRQSLFAASVLVVFQILFTIFSEDKVIFLTDSNNFFTTGQDHVVSFELQKDTNLATNIFSPVDNSWAEFEMKFVKENDAAKQYNMVRSVEYYHGVDSDGPWTEGSVVDNYVIPVKFEKGKYRVFIKANDGSTSPISAVVKLKYDVTIWSNFIVALIAMFLYPVLLCLMYGRYESLRSAQSDLGDSE